MSTSNDNIRRQLGFGLIAWNAPEYRSSMPLSRPQSVKPALVPGRAESASPVETLGDRTTAAARR